MRYNNGNTVVDDIPSLSQWIKNDEAFASPFFGASNRSRTGDLILTKDALYLLSYRSKYSIKSNKKSL